MCIICISLRIVFLSVNLIESIQAIYIALLAQLYYDTEETFCVLAMEI